LPHISWSIHDNVIRHNHTEIVVAPVDDHGIEVPVVVQYNPPIYAPKCIVVIYVTVFQQFIEKISIDSHVIQVLTFIHVTEYVIQSTPSIT